MSKSKARFLSELLGSTGLVKKSKSALAGADEVIDLDSLPTITNAKLENSSISIAGHSTALGDSVSLTTEDISEHTSSLYYTNARADARIVAAGSATWNTAYGWGNHASAGYLTSHQSLAAYAPLASPALTGTPTAPTASAATNTTQIATTAFVGTAVSGIVDSAPGTLNTLNELAAALGDDENFSTTVTNSIATKLPLAGGTLTGLVQSNSTIQTTANIKVGGYLLFDGNDDFTGSDYYTIQDDVSTDVLRIGRNFNTTDCLELNSTGDLHLKGGNLTVGGIINNTRGNGSVAPPNTADHTAGTRISFYDTNATAWYAMGIESDTLWFNSDTNYKWYEDGTLRMSLTGANLVVTGTLTSGTITTSGILDFTANPAYIRNNQDNSGQIIISAKNASGVATQVRWDVANNSAGAWRPDVTGSSNLGLTNRVWDTLYVNNIRLGSGNTLFVDASRNITAGAITGSGTITTSGSFVGVNAILDNVLAKTSSGNILFKTNGGASIARFNNDLSADFFGAITADSATLGSAAASANVALQVSPPTGNNQSALKITNTDGGAHTWLGYYDGNNYITGDADVSNGGITYIRSESAGAYPNIAKFSPTSIIFYEPITSGAITSSHSQTGGFKITATDSTANAGFSAMTLDYNLSGTDACTADRNHIGLHLDIDSSASGGLTNHEHRIYGIFGDVRTSGDSDLVWGAQFNARVDDFGAGNQITQMGGVYGQSNAHNADGIVATNYGSYGYALNNSSGTGQVSTTRGASNLAYAASTSTYNGAIYIGSHNMAQVSTAQTADISQVVAVWGEVQFDNDGAGDHDVTISNAFVFRAEYDENDGDDSYTVNTGYLYYGNYAGTQPTTAYGVYIADGVRNYFAGSLTAGLGSTTTASYGFNGDTNTGMYSPAGHEVGFLANGTQRLKVTSTGIDVTGAITSTGNVSLNQADGFVYLNNQGTGNAGIYVRGITSSSTLRSHSTNNFRWEVTGAQKMELNSSGVLNAVGGYQVNGTTVIDSSRRFYVSGGSIQHPSRISFLNGSDGNTGSGAQGIAVASLYAGTSYSNTAPSGMVNALNGYQVGNTTVIDSSRNLANIGTISSTAINTSSIGTIFSGFAKGASFVEVLNAGNTDGTATSPRFYSPASGTAAISAGGAERLRLSTNGGSFTGNLTVKGLLGFNATGETASIYLGDTASEIRATYNGGTKFFLNGVDRMEIEGTTGNLNLKTGNLEINSISVIDSSRKLENISVTTTEAEYGQSLNGNFGQWLDHARYAATPGFDQDVDYWGWNFVQGNINAPHTSSNQWYRNRVSLGNAYGHGISTGDYWLEIAHPRTTSASGSMYIRNCEGGNIGSWVEVGANIRGNQTVAGNIYLDGNIYHNGDTNTYVQFTTDRVRIAAGGVMMLDCVEAGTDYIDIINRVRVTAGGDLECEGNITAYSTTSISDINQKENIQQIIDPIEKIKQISGYTFDWKNTGEHSGGVIAQEVEQIMPDVVKEVSIRDGDEMKAVDYQAITGLLVETVKEQQNQINAQKEQITQLTKMVNALMEK